MYDALFTYEKFIAKLPDSYKEFADTWTESFGDSYDTKILSRHIISNLQNGERIFNKTELSHLFDRCESSNQMWKTAYERNKKKICNNLMFAPDPSNKEFRRYDCSRGKAGAAHDAGFDAYMTGLVFCCTTKYIEIGDLLKAAEDRKLQ